MKSKVLIIDDVHAIITDGLLKAGYDVALFKYEKMGHQDLIKDSKIIEKVVDFVCSA